MADEIQTGFGRTGKMFACDHEGVIPDMYILGKALGGGVFPISAVAANDEVMNVLTPGSHGSTFGGNPLACACAIAAMDVIVDEQLCRRSAEMGSYFLEALNTISSPLIKEIRGRGLFIGLELFGQARPFCEKLKQLGILCKETHEHVIRFAPPLVITKEELDWSIERIQSVFA
jgi:ornithine--oxo-acid transaminase